MKRTIPTKVDSTGWHARQYCAPVPPARPASNDFREHLSEQTPADNTPPGPQPQKKHLTPFGWC